MNKAPFFRHAETQLETVWQDGESAPVFLKRGSEAIVFHQSIDSMNLGEDPVMLVNSEKHNTGSAGLCHFLHPRPGEPSPEGRWFGMLGNSTQTDFLLLGFLPRVENRTFIRIRDNAIEAGWILHRDLQIGEKIITDRLHLDRGDSPHALLEKFGDLTHHLLPACPSEKTRGQLGWNSWDYYFGAFSIDELQESLEAIKEFNQHTTHPVDTVVIDMCWHTRFGEWSANGLWPDGMKHAADLIKSYGLRPGIWISPMEVGYDTRAFLRTPEILATGINGEIMVDEWAGGGFGWLDPTSEAGERFLFCIFQRLYQDGFRYYKLDFLHYPVTHAQALERKFALDGQIGRLGVIRHALSTVRKAIGPDSWLLSCGCMPEAAIGVANANRIGIDVSTYDSTIKLIVPFLATRYWMNQRCFLNDPDFLLVRSPLTATDSHHNPCHPANLADAFGSRSGSTWQTLGEIRIWATLVGISGGALVLGDHLGKLNATGRAILETVLAHASPEAARPLDLMEKLYPEIWQSPTHLAIFNWSESPKIIPLPPQFTPYSQDLWQNASITPKTLTIPPHDAIWLEKK